MRIAIDLTSTPKNKTGIGRYLLNLVEALQTVDRENDYYLFVQSDDVEGFNIYSPNFNVVPVDSSILRKTHIRIVWEQVVLPFRLKKLKIDVLHSPNFTCPYFCRVKKVVTFHDMTYFIHPEVHTPLKREMFKMYIKLSSFAADKILAISQNTVIDIVKYTGVGESKVVLTALAVDKRFYEAGELDAEILKKYGVTDSYLLYVGTVEPRKNILRLLQAYNSLDEVLKKTYKLVICGKKGWLYKEIFDYFNETGLDKYVHFTGFVQDEDLPQLYKGASAFLYVSIYEGFGFPVLEAMACGTPVITSGLSSMKEIAGDAALLVNPYDIEDIKKAICKLVDDDRFAVVQREKGVERAKEYSWELCAKNTLEAYVQAYKNNRK